MSFVLVRYYEYLTAVYKNVKINSLSCTTIPSRSRVSCRSYCFIWDTYKFGTPVCPPKGEGAFYATWWLRGGMSTKRVFQKEKGTFHAHPRAQSEEKKNKTNVWGNQMKQFWVFNCENGKANT